MDMFRRIDEAEFQRDFAATRERIFGQRYAWYEGNDPFVDRNWRVVPIASTPFEWPTPGPERPSDFPPIEPYFASYFEPLCQALAESGVDEVVVTRRTILPNEGGNHFIWNFGSEGEEHYLVPPTMPALQDIGEKASRSFHSYFTMFARDDDRWGVACCDFEHDFSVLGGVPDIVETFYRIAGSERNVRAWLAFDMFSTEVSRSSLDDTSLGEEFVRDLYKRAGWPLPNGWGTVFGNDDVVDWSWMFDDEGFPPK